ncbi:hypothetical protein B296_00025881 [Ensete ventricosum]|uniref:Uncharacterized protein n=1 Tax=Ensete ventricosum TaxID=4639 RepID=A0A427AKQ9_ENSVE|nr:hypothetical protein B296_00025881 [Ensete ventricosum]
MLELLHELLTNTNSTPSQLLQPRPVCASPPAVVSVRSWSSRIGRNLGVRLGKSTAGVVERRSGGGSTGAYIVGVIDHPYLATWLPLWLTMLSHTSTMPAVLAVGHASAGKGVGLTCVRPTVRPLAPPYLRPASFPYRVGHVGGPVVRGRADVATGSPSAVSFSPPREDLLEVPDEGAEDEVLCLAAWPLVALDYVSSRIGIVPERELGNLNSAGADSTEQELGNLNGAGTDSARQKLGNLNSAGADPTEQELGNLNGAGADPTEQELGNLNGVGADLARQKLGNWDVARADPTEQELGNCDVARADLIEQELGNWDVARADPTEQVLGNWNGFCQG